MRTAWLYSYYGKNFVKTIVNAGKKFGKLEVVNDQCGNPTNAVDLAHEIRMLRCTVGNDVRDWKDALACFFAHWDGENGMKG